MAEPLNHLVDPLGELIGGLSIAARVPQLEVAVSEGRALLVMRVLDPPNDDDIEKLKQFEKIHQIEFALQPKGPETVTDLDGAPLNPLRYTLTDFGITFEFTPLDFIQVNAPMNERLVASAIHALQCESHHQVLDVFCGLGNFTLPIAKHVKSVIGVEGDATLVERAKSTAKRHVITNAEFFMADCFKLVGQESWLKRPVDRLLLDPPRAGAKELIPWIPQLNPQRIVYVSCHPGTLARDLKMLNEVGYELQSVGIVDMFSHTSHIESMAVLVRR
jgi:23S rRNA (uracil1939-C5)-methyltransferase